MEILVKEVNMNDWFTCTNFTKDDRDWKESVEKRLDRLEQPKHHIFESPKPIPQEEGNE